jgi:FkbM family methyltransferase
VKLRELKANFPEILAIATLDANLSDDSEVALVEEPETIAPTSVSPTEESEDDKDRRIADLETQLTETNNRLAEIIGKDNQRTDITINVERANVAKANHVCQRRVMEQEKVPVAEKIISLSDSDASFIVKEIEIRRYALGETNCTAYLQVDPRWSIMNKIARGPDSENQNSQKVVVEMRDAETELQSVLARTDKNERIILKVDCEGSEREIFQRLSADTLSRIDMILLEWHHPDILSEVRQKLQNLNFQLLVRKTEKDEGLLYAFRK